ncbi:MarR family transcriptional regulator [Sporosarcina thermotolerans]|uniref:MarR family transcriptional regulator n=1 Tax=Sporosarcina thermotolerans TaxID=633404 RepID=A0AAW9A7G0_9BACL|nr:MarR family transcriptional regulator [Sporosarcina thermotolerans]MDW0117112.1 MarR family transcriptional regulator [Sporosarcina thermotolerans]WHT47798.1 MarR family transcriptional regulator [Sporosarcina thermotolerans]
MNPLIHELFQKSRLLSKELNNALKQYDLYAAQWSVIYCVNGHGEMTLTQIWKYLNVEAPTITRTVNRLEQMGWLETSVGKDRREKIVRLSGKAIDRMAEIEQTIIQFEEISLRNLTKDEEELLGKLLKKLG